jgi:hypothetical protein
MTNFASSRRSLSLFALALAAATAGAGCGSAPSEEGTTTSNDLTVAHCFIHGRVSALAPTVWDGTTAYTWPDGAEVVYVPTDATWTFGGQTYVALIAVEIKSQLALAAIYVSSCDFTTTDDDAYGVHSAFKQINRDAFWFFPADGVAPCGGGSGGSKCEQGTSGIVINTVLQPPHVCEPDGHIYTVANAIFNRTKMCGM